MRAASECLGVLLGMESFCWLPGYPGTRGDLEDGQREEEAGLIMHCMNHCVAWAGARPAMHTQREPIRDKYRKVLQDRTEGCVCLVYAWAEMWVCRRGLATSRAACSFANPLIFLLLSVHKSRVWWQQRPSPSNPG